MSEAKVKKPRIPPYRIGQSWRGPGTAVCPNFGMKVELTEDVKSVDSKGLCHPCGGEASRLFQDNVDRFGLLAQFRQRGRCHGRTS
jgi:hypothetical protein